MWTLPPWDMCVASCSIPRTDIHTHTPTHTHTRALPAEEDPEFTRQGFLAAFRRRSFAPQVPSPGRPAQETAEKARNPACQAPGPSAPSFGCRKRAGGNALPVGGKSRSCCSAASLGAASCHRRRCTPLPQPHPCVSAAASWPGSCRRHRARGAGKESTDPEFALRG